MSCSVLTYFPQSKERAMRGINGRKNERVKKGKYKQRKGMKACMKDK